MSILLTGLNYRTAPVEVRERLAFSREGVAAALLLFKKQFPQAEVAILSTCNRVEILISSEDAVAPEQVIEFLARVRDVPPASFREHLYRLEDADAVRHIFEVIGGLDSMVIGEHQIVNQLKQAYELAVEQNAAGPVIHRLFHHAFGVNKRLRSETSIAEGKTSMASVAVDCIRESIGDLHDRRILIVGAGEMARLSAEYLCQAEAGNFVVTTRTLSNARVLADVCHGRAVPFQELDEQLRQADVVITATSSPAAILTASRIAKAQQSRGGRALLLVDLAVPRNIEPQVRSIPGICLYDVDSLGEIIGQYRRHRSGQIAACQSIIEEEVAAFQKWLAESRVRPLIEQMYEDVRALAAIEVRGFFRHCPDLTEPQRHGVEQLADRLVGKLMHPCVRAVRQYRSFDSAETLADAFHGVRLGFAPTPQV